MEQKLKAEAPDRYRKELYNKYLMGYSMRTDKYRFTVWIDVRYPDSEPIAVELYDHQKDPDENVNIAVNPENAELIKQLTFQIKTKGYIGGRKCADYQ
jgi:hypothetical protein